MPKQNKRTIVHNVKSTTKEHKLHLEKMMSVPCLCLSRDTFNLKLPAWGWMDTEATKSFYRNGGSITHLRGYFGLPSFPSNNCTYKTFHVQMRAKITIKMQPKKFSKSETTPPSKASSKIQIHYGNLEISGKREVLVQGNRTFKPKVSKT